MCRLRYWLHYLASISIVLFIASCAGIHHDEVPRLSSDNSIDQLSLDDILARVQEAGRSVRSLSEAQDQWLTTGSNRQQFHGERIHSNNDFYLRETRLQSTREALFYGGRWFIRDSSSKQWRPQHQVTDDTENTNYLRLTLDLQSDPGDIMVIDMGPRPVYIYAPKTLARLDNEVIEGRALIRLRSTLEISRRISEPSPNRPPAVSTLIQDLWIGADDFLIYRVEESDAATGEAQLTPTRYAITEFSGYNQSELPGPLPD